MLRREALGSLATATVYGDLDPGLGRRAAQVSVELTPASLQQLVVNAPALGVAGTADRPEPTPELGAHR